jgi:hypothetical protein
MIQYILTVTLRHSYLGSFFLDFEGVGKVNIGAIWKISKGTGLLKILSPTNAHFIKHIKC